MKVFKKGCALIISAAMMISMASCGKESKIEKRERTTRESVIATIDRDNIKTTEDTTDVGTTESSTGVNTTEVITTEVTTEVTTEKPPVVDPNTEKEFKKFEDELFKYAIEESYLGYHFTVNDGSKLGLTKPEPTWGDVDWTDEAIEKDRKENEDWMNKLKAINRDGLSETDQISYDLYMEDFEDQAKAYDYVFYTGSFSPNGGYQERFANYFTDFAFNNKEDVEDYIALLNAVPEYVDKLIEFEKYRATLGYVMSDNNIDKVVEQCNTFTKDGENHFMIELFNNNADALDFLTAEEKEDFKAQNKDALLNKVLPAFEKIGTEVGALKGTGTNQGGLAGYTGGADCYATIMKAKTGSAKTPAEALEVLYDRMNNYSTELLNVYMEDPDAYNYFAEHYGKMLTEADTDMTSQEVIDKLMEVDTAEYPAIDKIPYTVSYFDKTLETIMDRTLAYYKSPTLDDPDKNIIRVNGAHLDGQWATLAHEGFPGHMYQYNYYMSTNPSNLRAIETFLGYAEGWAKYVEYNSYKAWDYPDTESDENVAKLIALDSEVNMLIFGIMDIEVNYNGWTVDDVKNWFTTQGYNADAAQEIFDIVAGDPGLYQSYVLGYYEMKGLRDKAEKELGDKFDPVEFHRVILTTGEVQYDILERQVDKYIQENK